MLAIAFPNINPVALDVGFVQIKWYSLAYIAGILLGYQLIKYLNKTKKNKAKTKNNIPEKAVEDLIIYSIFGIVIGGRLGYVLFYHINWIWEEPMRILKTWEGGMSFHGGLIGVILSVYILSKKHKAGFLKVMDLFACAAPIGLFFGRVANFINSELYGRVTDVSWGIIFPNGGPFPRHPSQIYEAAFEGVLLFLIMLPLYIFISLKEKPGKLSGIFLILYSVFRFCIEYFREPDFHLGFIVSSFTMGQLLCIPMFAVGWYVYFIHKSSIEKHTK